MDYPPTPLGTTHLGRTTRPLEPQDHQLAHASQGNQRMPPAPFGADPVGYEQMTNGAGLARYLMAAGIEVVEVNRPNRQLRRQRGGKTDSVDAEAAARAAAISSQTG